MTALPSIEDACVTVVGLGYIGVPLLDILSRRTTSTIIGYDTDKDRVHLLSNGQDYTETLTVHEAKRLSENVEITTNALVLEKTDVFVVTVPTPIDEYKIPNLDAIISVSVAINQALISRKKMRAKSDLCAKRAVVIYESTVYPGTTNDICEQILSKGSLRIHTDFDIVYSPERLSPGADSRRINEISKIVSGSSKDAVDWAIRFYSQIIDEEIYATSSIKVAEAAKILENTQRDVNIALVNELTGLFYQMGISIHEVIEAASSKWNFHPYKPGLVGGHCIGVDPYYLTYQSRRFGQELRIVNASRTVNDNMAGWYARTLVKNYVRYSTKTVSRSRLLFLGASFKEDCNDLRNSKALLLADILSQYSFDVDICDHYVGDKCIEDEGKQYVIRKEPKGSYDVVVFAVAHKYYKDNWMHVIQRASEHSGVKPYVVDLKNILPEGTTSLSL